MPDVIISGLGTALPEHHTSTANLLEHAKLLACKTPRQEKVLEELYRRTSIAGRNSVCTDQTFPPSQTIDDRGPTTKHRMQYYATEIGTLARVACDRAFDAGNIAPDTITHLVSVSCTGFYAPGFDIELIQSMGLRPTTKRTHVGFMGCHGGLNGLRVAQSYAASNPEARVLLCMAETCSLHFQYGWETDRLVANSLFADGAAALIIEQGSDAETVVVDTASFIIPNSLEEMSWRIGNNGFEMHLAATVPSLIETWLPNFACEWLAGHGLSVEAIAAWAVHPGGPKILDSVELALALPADALECSRDILASCGNMSSPTAFFILEKIKRRNVKGHCVVLGFGPGLTVEAALLKL